MSTKKEHAEMASKEEQGRDRKDGEWESAGGYYLSPLGLSDMVKTNSMKYVQTWEGPHSLAKKLKTDVEKGLPSTFDFDQRRKIYGRNYIELPPLDAYWQLVLSGFTDDFIIQMLLASAIVSLIIGIGFHEEGDGPGWLEGVAISLSILIVTNVDASTEYFKAKSFREQQLELESTKDVVVIRGGSDVTLNPRDIVVGDLLRIDYGNTIPADGYIVESAGLKVDESSLTGEPILIAKNPRELKDGKKFFLMSGTQVQIGSGKMIVCAVGKNSVQGRITEAINEEEDEDPSKHKVEQDNEDEDEEANVAAGLGMKDKLDELAGQIGYVGGAVASVCFVVMLIQWGMGLSDHGCDEKHMNMTWCHSEGGCVWKGSNATHGGCNREITVSYDGEIILGYFITAITILVVAIPEGLPLAITLSLAVAQMKLKDLNNMVKHLEACEKMGSATTVCSDKTGTLTQNKMTVMRGYFGKHNVVHDHAKSSKTVADQLDVTNGLVAAEYLDVLTAAILANCNATSRVSEWKDSKGSKGWDYTGNPTECALLKLTAMLGLDTSLESRKLTFADPIRGKGQGLDWGLKKFPFSSQRKKMSWIIPHPSGKGFRLYCKGAPKAIYTNATQILLADGVTSEELTAKALSDLRATILEYENAAMRTLAIAFRDFPEEPPRGWDEKEGDSADAETGANMCEKELTIIAVVGIEDPLRPDVPKAIADCRGAGVDVRMCTGDSLRTAIAIAVGCNILSPKDCMPADGSGVSEPLENFAMTGAEFDERVHQVDEKAKKVMRRYYDHETGTVTDAMAFPFKRDEKGKKVLDQQSFNLIWPTLRVLARCQPEDKLTLVSGLRRSLVFANKRRIAALKREHGIHIFPDYQVVAVTGDGTNDAPALKAADVGFAMGITGTDVAKSACDIMLMDDNFSSIVQAMKWGRNVFDSISKFIQFQVTVNIVALCVACIGAFAFQQSPLGAVQMLWVNLIMDSLASLALATEPPVDALLKRNPYGKRRSIISRVMWYNMIGHSIYQLVVILAILFAGHKFVPIYRCYNPDVSPYSTMEDGGAWPTQCDDSPYYDVAPTHVVQYPPSNGKIYPSEHWSVVFNAFVMMQIFNEFNSRKLQTVENLKSDWREWIVFIGVQNNPVFVVIVFIIAAFQVVIVCFLPRFFNLVSLNLDQWLLCIVFGIIEWPVQFLINAVLVTVDKISPGGDPNDPERISAISSAFSAKVVPEDKSQRYCSGPQTQHNM